MRIGTILAVTLLLLGFGRPAFAGMAGVREIDIRNAERAAILHVVLWYPAGGADRTVFIGENAVFLGTRGFQSAPMAMGRFPLVVILCGGFRAAPNVASWLGAALAADGFVAAVVNPPPVPQGAATESVLNELWLRPADVSATLTTLERDPAMAGQVNGSAIGAVGFFLGGNAVLALAGARTDAAALAKSCVGAAPARDCAWFARRKIDLRRVDAGRVQRSNRDRRIRAAVVIDPELTNALTRGSLGAIAVPVRVVNLGRGGAIPRPLSGARLAAKIPGARYAALPGATASSAFAECKPNGRAMLRGEGGEVAPCDDGAGRTRAQTHAALAALVEASLRHSFSIGR